MTDVGEKVRTIGYCIRCKKMSVIVNKKTSKLRTSETLTEGDCKVCGFRISVVDCFSEGC